MPDKFTPPKGPGVSRRMIHGHRDCLVCREPWHPPFFHEAVIEPLALMEIVILQIETLQGRICPCRLFSLTKGIEQPQLRSPIYPADQRLVVSTEISQDRFPLIQHPVRFLILPSIMRWAWGLK